MYSNSWCRKSLAMHDCAMHVHRFGSSASALPRTFLSHFKPHTLLFAHSTYLVITSISGYEPKCRVKQLLNKVTSRGAAQVVASHCGRMRNNWLSRPVHVIEQCLEIIQEISQ